MGRPRSERTATTNNTWSGDRFPGRTKWEGLQTAQEQGDRIGMLLDLDQGSMTVWKNGVQLGVIAYAPPSTSQPGRITPNILLSPDITVNCA